MSEPVTPPVLPVSDAFVSGDGPSSSAPPKSAAWEDVLDVFYSPRAVFARNIAGKYWMLLLILALLNVAIFFLSRQLNDVLGDVEFARIAKEQGMTPEQAAGAKKLGEKFAAFGMYFIPIFIAIGAWISGLMIWLFSRFMGGKLNFAQGTTIALLASMPETLERILIGAQGMFLDTANVVHKYSFSLGAARFLDGDANKWMLKLASLADPFVIWGYVLIGIGAHVIGKMEMEKAAVLAVIVALVTTILFR
jgi:Yip1 domain